MIPWPGFYQWDNPRDRTQSQYKLEFFCIDELAHTDTCLAKFADKLDSSFIHPLVRDYYCEQNSRPALDPTLIFELLFLDYVFGVRNERQLIRDVQVNVAYR